jgi:hypothetical protein
MSDKKVIIARLTNLLMLIFATTIGSIAQDNNQSIRIFEPTQSGITFMYPTEWMAVEVFEGMAVVLVNDPTYFDGNGILESGQMRLDIFTPQHLSQSVTITPDTIPSDVLQSFAIHADLGLQDTPTDIIIGDRVGAYALKHEADITIAMIAIEIGDGHFSLIFVTILPDDLDALLPLALNVVETISLFETKIEEMLIESDHLTQTFEFDSGVFSFRYSNDWFLSTDGSDLVTISEGHPIGTETIPDTMMLIGFNTLPYGTFNLTDALHTELEKKLALAPGMIDLADRVDFMINGRQAIYVEADDAISIFSMSVLIDDAVVGSVFATARGGELDRLREDALAIVATFQYLAPQPEPIVAEHSSDLTEQFLSADETTTFSYPANWIVEDRSGLIFVSNEQPSSINEAQPGQVVLVMGAVPYRSLSGIRENPTPMDVLYRLQPATGLVVGSPAYTSFNNLKAVQADIISPEEEGMIFVLELDTDVVLLFTVFANAGDLEDYRSTIFSIVSTLTFAHN